MVLNVEGCGDLSIDENRQDYIGMWKSRESCASSKYQHIFQAYTINKLYD